MGKDESPNSFVVEKNSRQVLVNSEKNNAISTNAKPRAQEVTSRYKNGIKSAPRSPSPSPAQKSPTSKTPVHQRSQSAERTTRPSTPLLSKSSRPSSPLSSRSSRSTTPIRDSMVERLNSSRRSFVNRAPDGLWPSIRSLSTSFQSESSSVSSSNASEKLAMERKRTPLRGRKDSNQLENSRPVENSRAKTSNQLRWPSMIGGKVSTNNALSKSVDLSDKISRTAALPVSNRGLSPTKNLKNTTNALTRPTSSKGREKGRNVTLSSDITKSRNIITSDKVSNQGLSPTRGSTNSIIESIRPVSSKGPEKSSKTISVSSESAQTRNIVTSNMASNRGYSPPARVLTNSRNEAIRPLSSGGREMGRNAISLSSERSQSKNVIARGFSPTRGFTPINESTRPVSSNGHVKGRTAISLSSERHPSLSRGMLSPSRTRPSTPGSSCISASTRSGVSSSVYNYISDVRKGKRSPSHIEESHQLRLLYNRDLQWRFVNASADVASLNQQLISEDMLYNVWNYNSELCESVILKRIYVQNLRQEMKLRSMLVEKIAYLEDWSELEEEHSISLSGTTEALKASTLRLPITGGARADVRSIKDAIGAAFDVMQAMGSSICHLLSRVEGTNSLISELSEVAALESMMLDECRELLASTAAMKVQECSLKIHLIQLRQECALKA